MRAAQRSCSIHGVALGSAFAGALSALAGALSVLGSAFGAALSAFGSALPLSPSAFAPLAGFAGALTNLSVMRSLSPIAMYLSRSLSFFARLGGSVQTPPS